jgi:hypothetical protein
LQLSNGATFLPNSPYCVNLLSFVNIGWAERHII